MDQLARSLDCPAEANGQFSLLLDVKKLAAGVDYNPIDVEVFLGASTDPPEFDPGEAADERSVSEHRIE